MPIRVRTPRSCSLAAPASHRGGILRVQADPFLYTRLGAASYGDAEAYELLGLAYDGLVAYRRAGGATFGTLVGLPALRMTGVSLDVTERRSSDLRLELSEEALRARELELI